MMDFEIFENTVRTVFPEINAEALGQFRALGPLYRAWNSKINVISRKDIDNLYMHHVLHSLAIAGYMRLNMPAVYGRLISAAHKGTDSEEGPVTVLDIGTGGGFPGIPLAILFPTVRFTLCDSVGKKILVAKEVAESCGLKNVETVNARAESLDRQFDYIVSRAVAPFDILMPLIKGKYREGVFCLKGGDVVEEIAGLMGRYKLQKGMVHVWKTEEMFSLPYYEGKLVIFLEGDKNRQK